MSALVRYESCYTNRNPLRNSAFEKAAHERLVAASHDAEPVVGAIDLLPQMLLPLCGTEDFDIDVR